MTPVALSVSPADWIVREDTARGGYSVNGVLSFMSVYISSLSLVGIGIIYNVPWHKLWYTSFLQQQQQLSNHVPMVMIVLATTQDSFDMPFSVWSVS
jgi:hypothetical protein